MSGSMDELAIASNIMSFPVVVPRNGTSWRNSSHTFRSAVTHTDEDGQLGRVLCVGALIKSQGEGNEGRDAGLQRVVYVVRHLLDTTTNGAGRKAHALKDRTLLRADGVHHSDEALLDEVTIREWLHPASKDAGNIITGTHYLVGLGSLLAKERSCFLPVA